MEQNIQEVISNVIKLINISTNRKFKKAEKLNFAYAYWNLSDIDIADLYNYLASNKSSKNAKLANKIGLFIDEQNISDYRKFYSGIYEQSPEMIFKITKKIKENGNWLSLYDIEREFTPKSTHSSPIIYSYLMPNNTKVTIDEKRASEIVGILTEAKIPTAKCIVTSSFPFYAHGNIDTYIKSFNKTK